MFDTGRIVITGGRSIKDVNSIFFRIRAMAPDFSSGDADTVIPREDRFYQRLSSMLVPSGDTMKDVEVVEPGEMGEMEALATLFEEQGKISQQSPVPAPSPAASTPVANETPLMRMALAGRVEEVKFMLACHPGSALARDGQGRTTLQRLRLIPSGQRTAEQQEIIEMLMGHNT